MQHTLTVLPTPRRYTCLPIQARIQGALNVSTTSTDVTTCQANELKEDLDDTGSSEIDRILGRSRLVAMKI